MTDGKVVYDDAVLVAPDWTTRGWAASTPQRSRGWSQARVGRLEATRRIAAGRHYAAHRTRGAFVRTAFR